MKTYRVYLERLAPTFVGAEKREALVLPYRQRKSAQAAADRLTRLAARAGRPVRYGVIAH